MPFSTFETSPNGRVLFEGTIFAKQTGLFVKNRDFFLNTNLCRNYTYPTLLSPKKQ